MINRRIPKKIDKSSITKVGIVLLSLITVMLFSNLIREINKIDNDPVIYESDPRIEFYRSFIPLKKWEVESPVINANAVAVILIDEKEDKFLFEKDSGVSFPIASITKLMTVLVAMEEYSMDHELVVSEEAFMKDVFRPSNLYPGETYKVKDLIYSGLVESSNTAAQTLAEGRTVYNYERSETPFISKMNQKARELGMEKTNFSNPSGLDPSMPGISINRSSPNDLLILVKYMLDYPLIWEILSTENYSLRTANGTFKYDMSNTNQLLNKREDIKGGKTGTTSRAGGNLLAVFERGDDLILTVILGSNRRYEDTITLLDWIEEAYYWNTI